MHKQISILLLCLLPLLSCTEATAPAPDEAPGDGGNFGHWTGGTDEGPVFHYRRPEGVTYTTSYGATDLHMHMIGNRRLNAFVRPEGDVDILIRDPGLLWLTRDPQRSAHMTQGAGVILPDGSRIAIPSASNGTSYPTEAEFGLGFIRFAPTAVQIGPSEVQVERQLAAAADDVQALIATTVLTNRSDAAVTLQFEERWTASLIPMLYGLTAESAFDDRAEFRDKTEFAQLVSAAQVSVYPSQPQTPRHAPADLSYYPTLTLAALTAGAETQGDSGQLTLPSPMALRWQLTLAPGASQTLQASFGTTVPASARSELTNPSVLSNSLELTGSDIPDWLSRELVWHAGQIRQSALYDGATGRHVIGQGSAYLYLHGLDGAQRDYIHFVVALALVDPELAKDLLRYCLQMVDASGHRYYAVSGYGVYDDAVIHTESTILCRRRLGHGSGAHFPGHGTETAFEHPTR